LALRLFAEVASHRDRFQPGEAEDCCRQALALAGEVAMRPLVGQCHLDLGRLYRRTGKHEEAEEHLATAATMFPGMDLTYWLGELILEAELREGG
jgi:tetratricopeptide (TPR) repeat protein